ncbi:MAG TPA: aminotransferase [Clostridiales bacterium]|nr:aminotransferase [Clostridiales bacterium]
MIEVFDEIIDRRNTGSIKYDFAERRGKPADVLPLWVADMDFRAPAEVMQALEDRSRHGIFGYSEAGPAYFEAVQGWLQRRLDWTVEPQWLIKTPGVVFAINIAIRALTCEGDSIMIQQPVYYPFADSIRVNNRRLSVNQLVYADGHYSIDFVDFEEKIIRDKVRLFILCNPHNPVGRVWSADELTVLGDICLRHGVKVIADEIHADFVYPGHRHQVFAALKPEFSEITVTCTSPSKTFNLAGLQISNIFIADPVIRRLFREEMTCCGYGMTGVMGIVACQAAYTYGDAWLDALLKYLQGNLAFLREFLQDKLPSIRLVEPEGTYLAWLDCRNLGMSDDELDRCILHEAGVWLDAGPMFGDGGQGFQRINIACPRQTLAEALTRCQTPFCRL